VEPTKVYPIVAVLSLVTVGVWRMGAAHLHQLSAWTAERFPDPVLPRWARPRRCPPSALARLFPVPGQQDRLFESTQWIVGAILLAGILAQSGGFFVHFGVGEAGRASLGTRLTRWGALLIATALVVLAVGIARA
jgi:hypothetical protein